MNDATDEIAEHLRRHPYCELDPCPVLKRIVEFVSWDDPAALERLKEM